MDLCLRVPLSNHRSQFEHAAEAVVGAPAGLLRPQVLGESHALTRGPNRRRRTSLAPFLRGIPRFGFQRSLVAWMVFISIGWII